MKIVFTDEAARDLEAIADYITLDNPPRARSFTAELIEQARGLADMPRAFPLVPRYEQHGIRRRLHGNYALFYRVEPRQITIIHILHGARDYEAILFPDD